MPQAFGEGIGFVREFEAPGKTDGLIEAVLGIAVEVVSIAKVVGFIDRVVGLLTGGLDLSQMSQIFRAVCLFAHRASSINRRGHNCDQGPES